MVIDSSSVGVIGLGLIGIPVAKHLSAAGYKVFGFDIDPKRREAAAEHGVVETTGIADIGTRTQVLISALPFWEALDSVCEELIRTKAAGPRILIELSTLKIEEKVSAQQRLVEADITLLDCPVLGTSAQAHAKELVMCASGSHDAFESVKDIIAAFTQRCEYLGDVGAGTKMKLIANLLVGVHNAVVAEALTLGECAGLEPATILRVLKGSAAGSRQLEMRGPMMVDRRFSPAAATTTVFAKDIGLISELARSVSCPVPMHSAASNLFTSALASGYADEDLSSVFLVLAALAGKNTARNEQNS